MEMVSVKWEVVNYPWYAVNKPEYVKKMTKSFGCALTGHGRFDDFVIHLV
jgi:hypothetical protein